MKKTIKFLSVLVAISLVIFSCKDEMSNEPFENGSAIISGTALVNTDFTNDTLPGIDPVSYENVIQGVHIYAEINSNDLVQFPAGGVDYGTIIVDTTVGVNGAFTLVVPANMNNVNVNFYADDFRADQIQFDETVESKIFYLPDSYTEVVRDGVTRITEITFVEK